MTTISSTTYDILSRDYPPLISVSQLASITGINDRTYRDWLRRGTMPVPTLRLGGVLRFRLMDVAQWIDSGAQGTVGGSNDSIPPLLIRRKRGRPTKIEQQQRQQGR